MRRRPRARRRSGAVGAGPRSALGGAAKAPPRPRAARRVGPIQLLALTLRGERVSESAARSAWRCQRSRGWQAEAILAVSIRSHAHAASVGCLRTSSRRDMVDGWRRWCATG
eukprot:5103985-Pyramimonas_sp.AAC.1